MPSRRNYLTSSAAALTPLVAGCMVNRPTSSKQASFGERINGVATVAATHRHSVFYVNIDSAFVHAFDGQAVHVTLDASGANDPPGVKEVSLVADGERYEAQTNVAGSAGPSFFEGERAYSADRETGWVLFEVPCPLDVSDARVEIGDAAWSLPQSVRSALADPAPSFELVNFRRPDAVPATNPITLAATVRHTGGPGPLRLVFTERVRLYNQRRVTDSVPVGETKTVSATFDAHVDTDDVQTVGLSVDGPNLESSVEVPVRES